MLDTSRAEVMLEDVLAKVQLSQRVWSVNQLEFYGWFCSPPFVGLVFEPCQHRLPDFLVERPSEHLRAVKDMVTSVSHLHLLGLAHGSLTMSSFVVGDTFGTWWVKMADLGDGHHSQDAIARDVEAVRAIAIELLQHLPDVIAKLDEANSVRHLQQVLIRTMRQAQDSELRPVRSSDRRRTDESTDSVTNSSGSPGALWHFNFNEEVSLQDRIGEGAFGEVYSAELTRSRKPVAVKLLHSGDTEELLDEAKLMSLTPEHPNLVSVLGVCHNPCAVIMQLVVDAMDAAEYLAKQEPFGCIVHEMAIISIAADTAKALAHLHGLQPCMLHRDLAARNVLCSPIGEAYLTDFGLSVLDTNNWSGTEKKPFPNKRAPSEYLCFRQFIDKSDCFMFGLLLWELVHGAVPFSDIEDQDYILDGLTRGTLQPKWTAPQGMLQPVSQLMEKLLHKDAMERPSMATVSLVLRRALSNIEKDQRVINHFA